MESALSLKTGHLVLAVDADYEAARKLILICPECREPVHLSRRTTPKNISYFAHAEYKGLQDEDLCSLRVLGLWDQPYKNSGPWASRGQLLKKIQTELISYFVEQFGEQRNVVLKYLKTKISDEHKLEAMQLAALVMLADTRSADIFKKIRETANLSNEEGRELSSHYNAVIACLQGRHLNTATLGLLWCSFVVSSTLASEHGREKEPAIGATCGERRSDFALDPMKFKKIVAGRIEFPKRKNLTFYRCSSICQRLLIRLLIVWKNQNALKNSDFIQLSSKPIVEPKPVSKDRVIRSRPTPSFNTLEERNRWLNHLEN